MDECVSILLDRFCFWFECLCGLTSRLAKYDGKVGSNERFGATEVSLVGGQPVPVGL